MNEKNKFRFKKNIRDFLNNLNKQFDEQKKIDKKLKNVLINRKFKFKFKLRFDKINNSNKRIIYMKLKNNVQNSSINFEMFLNNVIIIWQLHDFDDSSNNIKHYIANVEKLKQIMIYRSEIVFRKFKWHVNEVKNFKFYLAVVRFNSQFSVEFKRIKKHVNDLKNQNDKLKIKHESNKTRYQLNKSRFAKLHKFIKKRAKKSKNWK